MVIRLRSPLIQLYRSIRLSLDTDKKQCVGFGGVFKALHNKRRSPYGNSVFFLALPQVAGGHLLANHVVLKLDATSSTRSPANIDEFSTSKTTVTEFNNKDQTANVYGKEKDILKQRGDFVDLMSSFDADSQEILVVKREHPQLERSMFQDPNKSNKTSSGKDFKGIESLIDNWTEPIVKKHRRKPQVKNVVDSDSYEKCLNPFEDETGNDNDLDSKEGTDSIDFTNPFEIEIMEENKEINLVSGNPFEDELEVSGNSHANDTPGCSEKNVEETKTDNDEEANEHSNVENSSLDLKSDSTMKVDFNGKESSVANERQSNVESTLDLKSDSSIIVDSNGKLEHHPDSKPFKLSEQNELAGLQPSSSSTRSEDPLEHDVHPKAQTDNCKDEQQSNNTCNKDNETCEILRSEEGNSQENSPKQLVQMEKESNSNIAHVAASSSDSYLQTAVGKNMENSSTHNSEDEIKEEKSPGRHRDQEQPSLGPLNTPTTSPTCSVVSSNGDAVQTTKEQNREKSASQISKGETDNDNVSANLGNQRTLEEPNRHHTGDASHPSQILSTPALDSTEDDDGDVVLVTGGNGFLGQHIVKMLQLRAPHVKEIRVLDKAPFVQKLEYEAKKPVKIVTGNITDADFVTSSIKGVNSVLHIAGLVSFGTFPDIEGMKEVNVNGTLNIVNACLSEASVSRLVYCSTVDVVVGHEPIRGGDEDNTPIPRDFLFPGYPETKYQGERLVLGASQCARRQGPRLQSLALRANVMYGELDPFYVTSGLKMAKQRNGVLTQVGDGTAMFQQAYVGNTAWAFVCADRALKDDSNLTSRFFYVPDRTPIQNSFNFMRPYLEARGFQLSSNPISYNFVYGAISAAEKVAKFVSPLKKVNLPTQSCSIAYINMDIFFKGDKAKDVLQFEPLFSPVEARLLSMEYYQKVEL